MIRRALVLVACLALAFAAPAAAHDPGPYMSYRWVRSLTVPWRLSSGITVQSVRDRIAAGAAQWNSLAQPMKFSRLADTTRAWVAPCPSSYQDNAVFRRDIPEADVLGRTHYCTYSGTNELYAFQMEIDLRSDFYLGTGTPLATQYDLWSVAVHEFGHATGFAAHWDEAGFYCSQNVDSVSPTRHTMCPTIYRGTTMQRTLAPHDKDVFQNAY